MPREPVTRRPATIPAEMATEPPWQMIPIGTSRSCAERTRSTMARARRILSGAQPPGMITPSKSSIAASSARRSARTARPFLPRLGVRVAPDRDDLCALLLEAHDRDPVLQVLHPPGTA